MQNVHLTLYMCWRKVCDYWNFPDSLVGCISRQRKEWRLWGIHRNEHSALKIGTREKGEFEDYSLNPCPWPFFKLICKHSLLQAVLFPTYFVHQGFERQSHMVYMELLEIFFCTWSTLNFWAGCTIDSDLAWCSFWQKFVRTDSEKKNLFSLFSFRFAIVKW